MPEKGLTAVIGYAIGTAQILVLDWLRARWAHARQLRLLRADLRRVADFQAKFNLSLHTPPTTEDLPRPAAVSSTFVSTVAAVDFWLTDEHRDDNTQEALLGIADGLVALADIHGRATKELDAIRATEDNTRRREHLERLVGYANEYDRETDYVQYVIKDSIRELDRRLRLVKWYRQLPRVILPLPKGANPLPLKRGDPRLPSGSTD
jgi:hypothetical protein